MNTIISFIHDALIFGFIFFVTFFCLREGYYGLKHQTCRIPLRKPPLYDGYGLEAVVWGTLYSLLGIMYAVFMLEATVGLVSRTILPFSH